MSNPSADKGNAFERLVLGLLRKFFGPHLTRPRAGAEEDRGDIAGIPALTLELKALKNVATALSAGFRDLEREQAVTQTRWGVVIVKRPRVTAAERQYAVMELEQFCDLYRMALLGLAGRQWSDLDAKDVYRVDL